MHGELIMLSEETPENPFEPTPEPEQEEAAESEADVEDDSTTGSGAEEGGPEKQGA
jgi:hypothetical protein